MVTTFTKLTFEQFLAQYPDGEGKFELINGEIIKVEATRAHKNVARYLVKAFDQESERLGLNYVVDKDIVIKTVNSAGVQQGRNPDVGVVEESVWNANVNTYGALSEPIQLAVEVSSTNWDDDYIDKLEEYELLGIHEYWIVDYLAIASRNYLGNPKTPTVFVHQLVNGKYKAQAFKGDNTIKSLTFPELKITVEQIIRASGIYP
ncbi:MAG: Uma2 family endonuclease [Symploca sp. SIO2E9]|nr:Uma2 family endonuclease [Symploca sp. SIO2E9]